MVRFRDIKTLQKFASGRVDDWRGGGPARPDLYPLRFQSPLGEPDVRISRIRLSPGSCLRPRRVARWHERAHEAQQYVGRSSGWR